MATITIDAIVFAMRQVTRVSILIGNLVSVNSSKSKILFSTLFEVTIYLNRIC